MYVFRLLQTFSDSSNGADGRTRTGTRLPPLAPQASASTNSATSANSVR